MTEGKYGHIFNSSAEIIFEPGKPFYIDRRQFAGLPEAERKRLEGVAVDAVERAAERAGKTVEIRFID